MECINVDIVIREVCYWRPFGHLSPFVNVGGPRKQNDEHKTLNHTRAENTFDILVLSLD